jgi:hypothetical protein
MPGAFTFEAGGRTYTCTPEKGAAPLQGTWWWFGVSNDPNRYAAFEAAKGDTEHSVRTRIVAWYERRLWVRAQPAVPRERFGRPPGKPGAQAVAGKKKA